MAKAQGIAAVLLIIAIGVVIYFVLSRITIPPPEEGEVITPPTYSNDIITVENVELSELRPLNNTPVALSFYIRNNGDRDVKSVEINFFSPRFGEGETDLKLEELRCEDKGVAVDTKCIFSDVSSGDMRFVELKFRTPKEAFIVPVPFTIKYYVKYDYSGYRIANIPIIDGITVKESTIEFSQSKPTYGPVHLEFIPPVGGVEKVGEETVERYWGVADRPFRVDMILTHVGTLGKVYPINIALIELKKLERIEKERCFGFENSIVRNQMLDPAKELKFTCQFISRERDIPQFMARIEISLDYTYQFEGEQTIVVVPPE